MNYGYAPTKKDAKLKKRIEAIIKALPPDRRGKRAYVEVDGLYRGVRIRRLTHYSEEVIEKIVEEADRIHKELTEFP